MEKHLVLFAQDKNGYGESFERSFDSWSKVLKFMLMKKMFISPLKENQMYHSEKMRADFFSRGKYMNYRVEPQFEELRKIIAECEFNDKNKKHMKMFCGYLKHIKRKTREGPCALPQREYVKTRGR